MKTSHINLILVLLAIGMLIGGYYLLYQPEKDKEARLNTEINSLQQRYDELKEMEAHRDEYVAETENLKRQFEEELLKYAPDLYQENAVMYLKATEEYFEDWTNVSVGLPHPEPFYTLGAGASDANTGEIATGNEQSQEVQNYVCEKVSYPITFTAKYDEIKDYLDYVAAYKYRLNIETVNMSYNPETEICSGNIVLNSYAITGPGRTADVPSVNQPKGVENLFLGGEGAPAADSSPYTADNGEAIVSAHNIVMLLNNAKNDAADGVIIAASESDEKTYVSYAGNDVTDVKISVYAQDGKNFVKYEIGDKSYETEVLTNDVTIYVKSSDRVDSDDTNGVKVSVDNSTTIPVYFKVVDDSTAGRFSLGSKSGTVKVY
jgi:Tfp pilus assembly protein PilO